MNSLKIVVGLMMLGLFSLSSVYAVTDEAIFENARLFTVKVETSIQTPFIFDQKSSSSGTGFLIDKQRGWIIASYLSI